MTNKDRRKYIFSWIIFLWYQYYMTYYMVIRLLSQFYIWELMFDRIVDRVEVVRYILRFDGLSSVTSWKFLVDVFYVKQTE